MLVNVELGLDIEILVGEGKEAVNTQIINIHHRSKARQ